MKDKKLTIVFILLMIAVASACVPKKKFLALQKEYNQAMANRNVYVTQTQACENENQKIKTDIQNIEGAMKLRMEQIEDLKSQVADFKKQRDKQVEQVGDLTVLSKQANDNIKETLAQLERKDKYLRYLQQAKTKADSINLALAVNLKSVLKNGIEDEDVDVKVDKTVVYINLSDKMLFESGSYKLTSKANAVLEKIAKIVDSKPDLDVMVEGYTDNVAISNNCLTDNWDLSVKRSTAVVRILQQSFKVNPNRLIAAGRGEYNALQPNDTPEGRAINRRTRIIILPSLNQFYDLLHPNNIPD